MNNLSKPKKGYVVDGSTRGNPGPSKYKIFCLETNKVIYESDLIGVTTNNVTEFLAICHCVYVLDKKNKLELPIYSDSQTAISWFNKKEVNTSCIALNHRIKKALEYIRYKKVSLNKWHTSVWGENPADFGLKK